MARSGKRFRRWLIFAAVVILLAIIAAALSLPAIVRSQVRQEFSALGFPDATFTVDSVGLNETEIINLSLDPDHTVTASRVVATYSLSDLLSQQLDTIRLHDLRIAMGKRGNPTDPGALGQLRLSGSGGIPLRKLQVNEIRLMMAGIADETLEISINLEMTAASQTLFDGILSLEHEWASFRATLNGDLQTGVITAQTQTQLPDPTALAQLLRPFVPDLTIETASALSLSSSLRLQDGIVTIERAETSDPIAVTVRYAGKQVAATIDSLSFRGSIPIVADPLAGCIFDADLRNGVLEFPAEAIRFDGINGPVTYTGRNAPAPKEMQTLRIEKVKLGEQVFPAVSVQTSIRDRKATFTAESELLPGANVHASCSVLVTEEGLTGAVAISTPAFSITDPSIIGARVPDLAAWRVIGDIDSVAGTFNLQGGDFKWDVILTLGGVDIRNEIWGINLAGVRGTLLVDSAESGQALAHVILRNVDLSDSSHDVRLEDIQGDLNVFPDRQSAEEADFGNVTIGRITLGEQVFPKVTAQVRLTTDRVIFICESKILDDVSLQATGSAEMIKGALSVAAALSAPAFTIDNPAELPRRVPDLKDYRVNGSVSGVAGTFSVRGGNFLWQALVELDGVDVENRVWDMEVKGLRGVLDTQSSLSGFSKEWQTLRAGLVRFGALRLRDAAVRFRGTTNGVYIEDATCGWAGGTIRLADSGIDFSAGNVNLRLEVDQVELGQALDFMVSGRASGDGKVSGYWNLTPVWLPEVDLRFGDGVLESVSGEGWFRIESEDGAAELKTVKAENVPAAGSREELMDKIQRALTDFEFTKLRIEFKRLADASGISTHVYLQGKGPRGDRPLSFGGLTFNINGLDNLLRHLILRTHEAKEAMQRRVRKAFENVLETSEPAPDPKEKARRRAEDAAIAEFF